MRAHTQTLMFTTNMPETCSSSRKHWTVSPNPNPVNILVLWPWRPSESAPQVSRVRAASPCTSHTDSWSKTSGHLSASRLWRGLRSRPSWNMTESMTMQDGWRRFSCRKRHLWKNRSESSYFMIIYLSNTVRQMGHLAREELHVACRSGCYLGSYWRWTWTHLRCYLRTVCPRGPLFNLLLRFNFDGS